MNGEAMLRRFWVRTHRRWYWAGGIVAGLVALVFAASFLIDEPLRRRVESEMNQRLHGYTVRLGQADFHPIGLSIDFRNVLVTQDAHPDPPVARIAEISASVQWRALLHAAVVADFVVERPVFYIERKHAETEVEEGVPPDKRGWQDALQAMYPLKMNLFRLRDGEVTYVESGQARPLKLSQLNVRIEDVRNVKSRARVYPSPFEIRSAVFDTGRLAVDGNGDFLADPHPALLAKVALEGITLDYFTPVLQRYNVVVRRGTVDVAGDFEYGPTVRAVHVEEAILRGADVEWIHTKQTAKAEKERVKKVGRAAETTANRPDLQLHVDRLRVVDGTFGLVNRTAAEPYRVFLTETNLTLDNLSNHFTDGTAKLKLTGQFMGSGDTTVTGAFRSDVNGPDFDLNLRIVDTDVPAMNDLLRAHGKFDVASGEFSLYSELSAKNRWINGYVKPLFRGLQVYEKEQDRDKPFMKKAYEKLVGAASKILKNRARKEVATKADVSGPLGQPNASTAQVVVRLLQNAFLKAILPGFEREVEQARG